MIAVAKNFRPHLHSTNDGGLKRITGHELAGKRLGILGLGRIGQEVAKRAQAFGMQAISWRRNWDAELAEELNIQQAESVDDLLRQSDVLSLHVSLNDDTRDLINTERIALMPDEAIIVNTARGGVANEDAVAEACRSGKLWGYGTDVMAQEPMPEDHVFTGLENVIVTPHIGSRTYESVERQAMRAVKNLVNFLNNDPDYIQAN